MGFSPCPWKRRALCVLCVIPCGRSASWPVRCCRFLRSLSLHCSTAHPPALVVLSLCQVLFDALALDSASLKAPIKARCSSQGVAVLRRTGEGPGLHQAEAALQAACFTHVEQGENRPQIAKLKKSCQLVSSKRNRPCPLRFPRARRARQGDGADGAGFGSVQFFIPRGRRSSEPCGDSWASAACR